MFPFLIGKVLTKESSDPKTTSTMMFLFLIGKVLTLAISPSQPELGWAMFPFLIGKVLTYLR